MPRLLKLFACGFVAGSTASCGFEPTCTLNVLPAVEVEIRDGFDDTPLAETARGAVREGSFIDSLRPYGTVGNGVLVSRAAADERTGVYSVTVEHDGYAEWRMDGVRVRGDECHVETVVLSAYLQRTP
jgi:hypothetical protein